MARHIDYQIPGITQISPAIAVKTDGGPWAEHNFPCPVCKVRTAIMSLDGWFFRPCWECTDEGWALIHKAALPWWKRMLLGRTE
jgi:hypothetical protein